MPILAAASAILVLLQQAPAESTDWDAEFGVKVKHSDPVTGELPVDPSPRSNANAGAVPYDSAGLVADFGGREVITRSAVRTVALSEADPAHRRDFRQP